MASHSRQFTPGGYLSTVKHNACIQDYAKDQQEVGEGTQEVQAAGRDIPNEKRSRGFDLLAKRKFDVFL